MFEGKMFTKGQLHSGALFNVHSQICFNKLIFLLRKSELCEVV